MSLSRNIFLSGDPYTFDHIGRVSVTLSFHWYRRQFTCGIISAHVRQHVLASHRLIARRTDRTQVKQFIGSAIVFGQNVSHHKLTTRHAVLAAAKTRGLAEGFSYPVIPYFGLAVRRQLGALGWCWLLVVQSLFWTRIVDVALQVIVLKAA